jgi:hypothetical protein
VTVDIIQRFVKGYGWLPLVERDGEEIYRGEFQGTPGMALEKAVTWLEGQK